MKTADKRHHRNILNDLAADGEQGVIDEKAFRFVIKREQARADRTGGKFSMAIFELPDRDGQNVGRQLVDVITHRIRLTDNVGWLNTQSLGVLLPDTPREGARAFKADIFRRLTRDDLKPDVHIHMYPDPPYEAAEPVRDQFIHEVTAIPPARWKRMFEMGFALIALIMLFPLMLLIAAVIKLSSPGPVLFTQTRMGYKGIPFDCYKFRSMHLNSPTTSHEDYLSYLMQSNAPMQKMDKHGDPRVFPAGRLLRASSLDELPQLFNILKGEMSLIGPRPSTPSEYNKYLPWHRHRVDTLPGMTGLWQVSGKNKLSFAEMIRLDTRYARHQSIWLDIAIILKTFPVIIGQYVEERRDARSQRRKRAAEQPETAPTEPAYEKNVLALLFLSAGLLNAPCSQAAQVLFYQAENYNPDIEQRLTLAARFYGIDVKKTVSLPTTSPSAPLVIEASCLEDLRPEDIPPDTPAVLIAGINTQISPELLKQWTGKNIQIERATHSGASKGFLTVSTAHHDITLELTGQRLPVRIAEGYQLKAPADSALLSYLGGNAQFTLHPMPLHPLYLLADLRTPLPIDQKTWLQKRGIFAELAPYLFFLKKTFGERGWHSDGDYANLTIDDPWMDDSYGRLHFGDFLKEMDRADFHTTIGFIPWNFDRSFSPAVLELFRNRTDRYSLCLHGNNHDHREFYRYEDQPDSQWPARPLNIHEANIRQGIARMERFQIATGVPYDRVMVFPHDIAPEPTLSLLSKYNFLATANIGKVPLDSPPPQDPLFWLRQTTDLFGSLATLNRTETHQRTETDIAIDLYLDNPVLFVEHLLFFADDLAAFNRTAAAVNRIQPETRWAGMGTIARHLYLMRKEDDGSYAVRAFSPEIILNNPESEKRRYHITKMIDHNLSVEAILADGQPVPYTRQGGRIQLELQIPSGGRQLIQIIHQNDFDPASEPVSKPSLRINTLRRVSDIRDKYLTFGFIGFLIDQLYYNTNLYRMGLIGLSVIAACLLAIPIVLAILFHRLRKRRAA